MFLCSMPQGLLPRHRSQTPETPSAASLFQERLLLATKGFETDDTFEARLTR